MISVDLQRDFTAEGGLDYCPRPAVGFIKGVLVPHLRARGLTVAEIVSDYRQPRPGSGAERCVPGQPGYESELPADVKDANVWVKAMHSPAWVRENGGVAGAPPGWPYPDPAGLTRWLEATVGPPREADEIVLIGLTLDCCVLCAAQALHFRGYRVRFLVEAVDSYSGSQQEKLALLECPLRNWGRPLAWAEFAAQR